MEARKDLWSGLLSLSHGIGLGWLLMGDFNAVLHLDDRLNGAAVSLYEIIDFSHFIQSSGCSELRMVGWSYTWSNKAIGDSITYSRIEKALGNLEWVEDYSALQVEARQS